MLPDDAVAEVDDDILLFAKTPQSCSIFVYHHLCGLDVRQLPCDVSGARLCIFVGDLCAAALYMYLPFDS